MEDHPMIAPPPGEPGYTGPDRRSQSDPLTQAISAAVGHVQNGGSKPPQDPARLVIAGAVMALQIIILVSQFRLADRQADNTHSSERFRNSLTCFLVEFSKPPDQQRRGTDLLTACGFLTAPTPGGN